MVYKRYLNVTILIMVCFISSFLSLFEGMTAMIEAYRSAEDMYVYGYKYSVIMHISSAYEFTENDLYSIRSEIKNGNVFIPNMYLYFDGYDNVCFNPAIMLVQNEKLPVPCDREIKSIPDGSIIVPRSSEIHRDELKIHGNLLKIYAEIDDEEHFSKEMRYTMNASTYFKYYTDGFDGRNFAIQVSSNVEDPYAQCVKIERALRNISQHFYVEYSESNYDRNIFSYANDDSILISNLLYIFAVLNAVIISYYWVTVRKREISIRKAYGATNIKIWEKMFFELLAIVGTAGIIAYSFGGLIQILSKGWTGLSYYLSVGAGFAGLVVLATLLALIIPLKKIVSIEPREGVSG